MPVPDIGDADQGRAVHCCGRTGGGGGVPISACRPASIALAAPVDGEIEDREFELVGVAKAGGHFPPARSVLDRDAGSEASAGGKSCMPSIQGVERRPRGSQASGVREKCQCNCAVNFEPRFGGPLKGVIGVTG